MGIRKEWQFFKVPNYFMLAYNKLAYYKLTLYKRAYKFHCGLNPMLFPEELKRSFGFLIHDVSRLMRTTFARRAKSIGLTRSQWLVLNHLYRRDGLVQAELAEILEIERPTLGRLLDRLEAKGWIHRELDLGDRRVKRVYLTEEVKPAMKSLRRIAAELRQQSLDGLDENERERLVDILIHMKSNLLNLQTADKS